MVESMRDLLDKIKLDDIQKVYVSSSNKVVGIDCDIYHLRLENTGRNKNIASIIKTLEEEVVDGDTKFTIIKEIT
jgi:hypothetical protein